MHQRNLCLIEQCHSMHFSITRLLCFKPCCHIPDTMPSWFVFIHRSLIMHYSMSCWHVQLFHITMQPSRPRLLFKDRHTNTMSQRDVLQHGRSQRVQQLCCRDIQQQPHGNELHISMHSMYQWLLFTIHWQQCMHSMHPWIIHCSQWKHKLHKMPCRKIHTNQRNHHRLHLVHKRDQLHNQYRLIHLHKLLQDLHSRPTDPASMHPNI